MTLWGLAHLSTLLYFLTADLHPILQSPSCSLVRPRQILPEQTINVVCHCTDAELQYRLFYQARLSSSENDGRVCFMSHDHQPLWCCDSCLMLPNRPYHVLARMSLSSCLVAEFNHPPCHLFHCCVTVKLLVPCKSIANTGLGLATSSMNKAAAILNSVTFSMECPRETSAHTQAHVNV